jgi:hypothetical protein
MTTMTAIGEGVERMIMRVEPRFEGWEHGDWKAYCTLCDAYIGKSFGMRWTARRAAAQHLNQHRHNKVNVEQMRAYGERERQRVQREIDIVKARREHRAVPPVIKATPRPNTGTPLPVQGECPTPSKKRHWSKGEGKDHITSLTRAGRGNPDYQVYPCACGWYHVGHSSVKFQKRIKKVLGK